MEGATAPRRDRQPERSPGGDRVEGDAQRTRDQQQLDRVTGEDREHEDGETEQPARVRKEQGHELVDPSQPGGRPAATSRPEQALEREPEPEPTAGLRPRRARPAPRPARRARGRPRPWRSHTRPSHSRSRAPRQVAEGDQPLDPTTAVPRRRGRQVGAQQPEPEELAHRAGVRLLIVLAKTVIGISPAPGIGPPRPPTGRRTGAPTGPALPEGEEQYGGGGRRSAISGRSPVAKAGPPEEQAQERDRDRQPDDRSAQTTGGRRLSAAVSARWPRGTLSHSPAGRDRLRGDEATERLEQQCIVGVEDKGRVPRPVEGRPGGR